MMPATRLSMSGGYFFHGYAAPFAQILWSDRLGRGGFWCGGLCAVIFITQRRPAGRECGPLRQTI